MWIFTNKAYISVVQDRDDSNLFVVRARVRGDIKKIFPNAKVTETTDSDYRFRTWVTRDEFHVAMDEQIDAIDYTNFKNSVTDKKRHDAYLGVWTQMYNYQYRLYGPQDMWY